MLFLSSSFRRQSQLFLRKVRARVPVKTRGSAEAATPPKRHLGEFFFFFQFTSELNWVLSTPNQAFFRARLCPSNRERANQNEGRHSFSKFLLFFCPAYFTFIQNPETAKVVWKKCGIQEDNLKHFSFSSFWWWDWNFCSLRPTPLLCTTTRSTSGKRTIAPLLLFKRLCSAFPLLLFWCSFLCLPLFCFCWRQLKHTSQLPPTFRPNLPEVRRHFPEKFNPFTWQIT